MTTRTTIRSERRTGFAGARAIGASLLAAALAVALSAFSATAAAAQVVSGEQRHLVRPASDTLPREPWAARRGEPPASARRFEEVLRYRAPEARQGVAADAHFFYAVGNRTIAKYDRETGEKVGEWTDAGNGALVHMNSCIVLDARLVCAHSNHPGVPMLSSIEVWNPETLEHIESHSFGAYEGFADLGDPTRRLVVAELRALLQLQRHARQGLRMDGARPVR